MTDSRDYMRDYLEFWADIVEDDHGNLDRDKVARELSDYLFVQSEVPKVYCEVTDGYLSKPNYYASSVLTLFWGYVDRLNQYAITDFLIEYNIPDPREEKSDAQQ